MAGKKNEQIAKRNEQILKRKSAGEDYKDLANEYGLSRSQAWCICNEQSGISKEEQLGRGLLPAAARPKGETVRINGTVYRDIMLEIGGW